MDFEDMKWIQEIIRKANVKIDMELLDTATFGDAIRPRLAAGTDLPDVIQLPSKDEDMTYIKSGIFLELTDLYEKYAINLNWRFEDNPTVKPQITTPDGKIYYVPVINMSRDYIPNLLINEPWLKELGLSAPTTTEEFYEVMKAFKERDPNVNEEADELPFYVNGTGYLKKFAAFWGLDLAYTYVVGEDGKLENSYVTDRYKDFLEYMYRMHEEGLLNNDFATNTNDMLNERMANNQIGCTIHYINFAHTFALLLKPDIDVENDPLIMVPMLPLQGPYGHRLYYGHDPVAGFFAINKNVEHPEAVFCFMDYLFSEEANNLMYYGIEGEDYEIIDGKIKPDLEKRSKDNYATRMGNNFGGFPRILLAAHRDVSYMPDIAVWNKQIREYNKLPDNISTFWLPDEVEIMQQYGTDLGTYLNEMFVKFITGEVDLAAFDDYVATAKSMGLEELLRIYQARYDRVKELGDE